MRKWYEHGDERLKTLLTVISRIFRKSRLTLDFDNINQPISVMQKESRRIYKELDKKCDDEFFDLAYFVYMEAYSEALPRTPDAKKRAKAAIDPKWMHKLQSQYDPVTRYVYDRETERKRARFFESVVADIEQHSRRDMEKDYLAAEKSWARQARQAMITVEDQAARTADKDAGVEKVMWMTEEDERVCEECEALDGLIFPIDRVPPKPHYNCRCWIEPVDDLPTGAKKTPGWQDRHADRYYEEVRKRKRYVDANKIAAYTRFTAEQVEDIRQHMFIREQPLDHGTRIERFASDYYQAQAWQRLTEGRGTDIDKILLEHEYLELTEMRLHGYNYDEAHEIANQTYNWWAEFMKSGGEAK